MKKAPKPQHTSPQIPSHQRVSPTPPILQDLTDADLEQVQGGQAKHGSTAPQRPTYTPITMSDCSISGT